MAPGPPRRELQPQVAISRALHAVGREVLCREAPLLVEVDFVLGCGGDLDNALCCCCRYYCGRHGND